MTKINSEIEKLLINFDYINTKEIIENIAPELEESIFQIIDDILNCNIINAIKKIDIIL
jgi:DNA polymerase III delta subunit